MCIMLEELKALSGIRQHNPQFGTGPLLYDTYLLDKSTMMYILMVSEDDTEWIVSKNGRELARQSMQYFLN